jgi:serine/threonine protein kinase
VRWLSDSVLHHLAQVADWPDVTTTRYEVVERIGRGGMATVFRAVDRQLGREVALKVLMLALPDPNANERLLNEARVIAGLEHPGIVPVHDAGILSDGRLFYAMKLVRGKRLDQVVTREMTLVERLRIFEQICQTIAFAHAGGVLHRDLKPQNIMVGAFGEVLVMDWGLAKACTAARFGTTKGDDAPPALGERRPGDTASGTVLGTPGYMAPEQAAGAVDSLDERTDVYALGAILQVLLTGDHPADQGGASFARRANVRSIPRPLRAVCLKALATDPNLRYQTVSQLAEDIGRFLVQTRVLAYPEGPLDITVRLIGKYRAAILLILAYLAMRLILLFFAGS